ncbi:Copper/zinc superoxide dismutase (SODC) [Nonomuraea coxensis DSM 45129]|uniref:Copper/zinc superoxide dismutase (SODC) n=1 Tax=Nonomuraea coxensis DSM 45129 TaxID=1122611 RepID=A0ABX8U9H4_9ACTN|nr:superoxide dismutase family protein [Nonomuraea coxensis]QYC44388.1 Copper/zinc superoxide dismutase (SODC) [Nonomuraea coxensis DSM 45129]
MRVPAFLLVLLAAAGCAGPPPPMRAVGPSERPAPVSSTAPEGEVNLSSAGEFTASDTGAIAYDRKLVPEGAQASVTVESSAGVTRTSLVAEGLLPGRRYGAHLHTKPCGGKPDESGPHYQHHPGQVTPESEVWLDFTTDGEGAGRATARQDWALDPDRLPGSLVIHAKPTVSSGPQAGAAGDRVACLTLR